ncbi:MAG: lipase family protein [Cytophagales bacterium]|nr:lipase family protein [Cytophagales bacterium]
MKQLTKFLFLFSFTILLSCEDKSIEQQGNQYLLEYNLVNSYSLAEYKAEISKSFGENADQVLLFVQSGVDQYKITYHTKDLYGNDVTASGAVMIPADKTDTPLAMASLQHGTLFNEQDAPSYFNSESEVLLGSFFASTGILSGMPDYVGYGESKNSDHPYEHREGLAVANVDFLRAMHEFLKEKNIPTNGNLLLAGYSEGGYATMATHKYLQDNLASEFPVTVSVCGAGAYDKTASFNNFVNEPSAGIASNNRSYLWVLDTYNKAYDLNLDYDYIFKEPYASRIKSDGYNALIDISFNESLNQAFIDDFNSGNLPELAAALKDNDIYDWKPTAITRLYHGNADDYVPYLNSERAFSAMKARNASGVEFVPVDGGTHGSTISSFVFGVLELFTIHKSDS